MRWFLSLALVALLSWVEARSSSGHRLLVVIEEDSQKDNYSKFWGDLKDRGFVLTFESPKNEKLALLKHGERAFDHVILLPPKSKGLGPALTAKILLDFTSKNGNIFVALSGDSSIPSAISAFLLESDIHLSPDRNTLAVDHFNYDTLSAAEKHDVLILPRSMALRPDVKNFFGGEGLLAFPRAVGQTLGDDSPLVAPILKARSTSYTYSSKDEADTVEDPFAIGSEMSLVSAMQARNSARITVFGSVEALEDRWFDASVQGPKEKKVATVNRDFAQQVTKWAFMETGVLKVGQVEHRLSDTPASSSEGSPMEALNPKIYRVKNDVTFSIELSEYDGAKYAPPALATADALQLEFTMLSPFHRLALLPVSSTSDSTIYRTNFTLPDQHGIFAFKVNYKRPFFTNIEEKREVTVRHFAHDEWPRSWTISGAWPWIGGIWITIAGWLAFVAIWLWSEPSDRNMSGTKLQ